MAVADMVGVDVETGGKYDKKFACQPYKSFW